MQSNVDAAVERIDALAQTLYATSCALDPVDDQRQPDWGRGGYKTEVLFWQGLARAAIAFLNGGEACNLSEKEKDR